MAIIEEIRNRDAATIARKVLREEFPGIRFSVRTAQRGDSVDVRWTDGPTSEAVEGAIGFLEGKRFDGMTDSTSYAPPVLYEGRIIGTHCYVFAHREYSASFLRGLVERYRQHCPEDVAPRMEGVAVREYRGGLGAYLEWTGEESEPWTGSMWLTQEILWTGHRLSASEVLA